VYVVVVCTRNGTEYQVNEEIVLDCDRCTCGTNGMFTCVQLRCPTIDGPICLAEGDPHYLSWDGRRFDFHGICEYVMAQSRGSNDFVVSADNDPCGNGNVACVRGVRITLQGVNPSEIYLGQQSLLYFNGVQQPGGDQTYPTDSSISVRRTGGRIFVTLQQHGVEIDYDGSHYLRIRVASTLRGTNRLDGLCGNYNGNPSDDPTTVPALRCPGGTRKRNANSVEGCDNTTSTIEEGRQQCGVMRTSSVFSTCNSAVDPAPYIANCEFDYCCGDVDLRESYVCGALSSYAAECTEGGVQPSNWRGEFCCKYISCNSKCPKVLPGHH